MMGLVLAGAAAFALTACSGNNASQSTEAAATTVPGTQTEAAAETESGSYTVTDVRGKEIEFDVVPERVATVGKPFPSSTMRSRAQRTISSAATHLPSQRTMKAC